MWRPTETNRQSHFVTVLRWCLEGQLLTFNPGMKWSCMTDASSHRPPVWLYSFTLLMVEQRFGKSQNELQISFNSLITQLSYLMKGELKNDPMLSKYWLKRTEHLSIFKHTSNYSKLLLQWSATNSLLVFFTKNVRRH